MFLKITKFQRSVIEKNYSDLLNSKIKMHYRHYQADNPHQKLCRYFYTVLVVIIKSRQQAVLKATKI